MATQQQRATALTLRRTFQASRERVFRAWTSPEEMKRWKGPGDRTTPIVEVDLRVGGAYRVHMRTPSFGNLQALPALLEGTLIADSIASLGSMDFVLGDTDR